jgi:nitrogen PTS system EIIA component
MDLSDILTADAIMPRLKANSKKQVLLDLAARAAILTGRGEREILETLLQREKLGSTGVGHGVAIPHGKLAGLARLTGVFACLDRPIDFDSLDNEPVDILFVLLAPENAGADHLKALARIARVLRDQETADKLRVAADAAAIYALLTDETRSPA